MPGIWELLIVLAIVLLLFGGKRLKSLGGDLGSAIKGFRKSMNNEKKTPADDKNNDIIDAKVINEKEENKP